MFSFSTKIMPRYLIYFNTDYRSTRFIHHVHWPYLMISIHKNNCNTHWTLFASIITFPINNTKFIFFLINSSNNLEMGRERIAARVLGLLGVSSSVVRKRHNWTKKNNVVVFWGLQKDVERQCCILFIDYHSLSRLKSFSFANTVLQLLYVNFVSDVVLIYLE